MSEYLSPSMAIPHFQKVHSHSPKSECPQFLRKKSTDSTSIANTIQKTKKSPAKSTGDKNYFPKEQNPHFLSQNTLKFLRTPKILINQKDRSHSGKFLDPEQKEQKKQNKEESISCNSNQGSEFSNSYMEDQGQMVQIRVKQVGKRLKDFDKNDIDQQVPHNSLRKSYGGKPTFTPKETIVNFSSPFHGNSTRERKKSEYGSPKKFFTETKERKASVNLQKKGGLYKYNFLKKLGSGAFADVHLVQHAKTNMVFALKVINKEKMEKMNGVEQVFREIKILLHVKHQNLVNLYEVFSDNINIYMVLEYMADGSIYQEWKKEGCFKESKVSAAVYDICKAVKKLHECDIIHRDLKLENIMHSFGVVKVGDLGCAVHSISHRKSIIGTLNYFSPQQLAHNFYSNKVDVWSIGVLAFELLFGQSPYAHEIRKEMSKKEQERKLPPLRIPSDTEISQEAKDFLFHALDRNSSSRSSIETLLEHKFLIQKKSEPKFEH